ncbi:hypothetical protein ACJW30_01G217600 [Castanea mollissima]
MLLLHLKPNFGVISVVGDGNMWCLERERQALLEFQRCLIDDYKWLSSWGSEYAKRNCCSWEGVYYNNKREELVALGLSNNSLSGDWPWSLQNCTMVGKGMCEYGKNFGEMRSIHLANNKLTGKIPDEICSLIELKALNLSGNMLIGMIPQNIGQLEQLESLDLSRNRLFGSLPDSMVALQYLGFLYLSYNEFSGRIPTITQLQSFDSDRFLGNLGLCGPPLIEKCPEDVTSNTNRSENYQEDGDESRKCLYVGMGLGFIVGFW